MLVEPDIDLLKALFAITASGAVGVAFDLKGFGIDAEKVLSAPHHRRFLVFGRRLKDMREIEIEPLRQSFIKDAGALARLELPPAFRSPAPALTVTERRLDQALRVIAEQKRRTRGRGREDGGPQRDGGYERTKWRHRSRTKGTTKTVG